MKVSRTSLLSALKLSARVTATVAVTILAVVGARKLWIRYNVEPWTRDGRVRANIVEIAPDVSGLVTKVLAKPDEVVHAGAVLFMVDPSRYRLAARRTEDLVLADSASLAEARRVDHRNHALGTLTSKETLEEGAARVKELEAQLAGALRQRDLARLNLERTVVRATVNGVVTNLELEPGDYAVAGHQALALVDTASTYVDGYFEETKLPEIHVGDRAIVHLMGLDVRLSGTVAGIAPAIQDRDRGPSGSDLANINPTFSWVRLAQRIPVRIELDRVPASVRLIAGRTATVYIVTPRRRAQEGAR